MRHMHTHTQPFYGSLNFVLDNLGEPIPEETFTHSHLSWSSVIPYLLPPSIMIHGILPVQFTCLIFFFHNLSPSFLWSTSWSTNWHPLLDAHTFLHPIIVFFLQHVHTIATCFAVVLRLCHLILVSLSALYLELYLVAYRHTSILPFSSLPAEVRTHSPFLQARSHFHATYYFAHNCCTISLFIKYTYW